MLQIHMFDASNHHVPWFLHRFHQFSMVNSQFSVIFGTQKWPMNPTSSCPPSSSPPSDPVAPPRPAPPPPWRRRPDGTTGRPLYWWILSANWGIQICFLLNLFVWEIVVVYQYIYIYIYISVQWGEVWGYLLAILLLLYCIQLVYSMVIYLYLFCLFLIIYLLVGFHEKPLISQTVAKGHLWEFRLVWRIQWMNEWIKEGRKERRKEGTNLKQNICWAISLGMIP